MLVIFVVKHSVLIFLLIDLLSYSYKKTKINAIKMNNSEIPKVDNIIYLGLPIGDDKFKEDFIKTNFKKCERAFYSLYGL